MFHLLLEILPSRQANAALYRITLSRLRWDQRTQGYLRRRLSEGKTRREAIRCLSDIAREAYPLLIRPSRGPPGALQGPSRGRTDAAQPLCATQPRSPSGPG